MDTPEEILRACVDRAGVVAPSLTPESYNRGAAVEGVMTVSKWPPVPTHELVCRMVEDKFKLPEIAAIFRITIRQVRELIWEPEATTT